VFSTFPGMQVEAAPLYAKWSEKEDDMSKIIRSLPGLRIIRQDPVECLFAFICSSNNNIQRITQMIAKLKATYGELLFHDPVSDEEFFAFPTVEALTTRAEESTLRDLGFGYRAPFIIKSSALLKELGGVEYLKALREIPPSGNDDEYADKLMAFSGVGRKVADCIGLFALNKLHAIPVDTHVWQIACREFDPSLKDKKSLTPTVYQTVGDHFRARFSPLAGWAHSVLFTGDLTSFKTHLPKEMQQKKKPAAKSKRPTAANLRAEDKKKAKSS
jgi:N-glycosylase/DNA lyase